MLMLRTYSNKPMVVKLPLAMFCVALLAELQNFTLITSCGLIFNVCLIYQSVYTISYVSDQGVYAIY